MDDGRAGGGVEHEYTSAYLGACDRAGLICDLFEALFSGRSSALQVRE